MTKVTRRSFVKNMSLGIWVTSVLPTLLSFENMANDIFPNYDGKKLNIALCGLGRYANILAKGLEETSYCGL